MTDAGLHSHLIIDYRARAPFGRMASLRARAKDRRHQPYMRIDTLENLRWSDSTFRQRPPDLIDTLDRIDHRFKHGRFRQARAIGEGFPSLRTQRLEGALAGKRQRHCIGWDVRDCRQHVVDRRKLRSVARSAIDQRPVFQVHVTIAGYGSQSQSADELERSVGRNGDVQGCSDIMICSSFVFPRRIDAEYLREILDMDPLAICATIETFDEQDSAVRQRLELLRDTCKL